MMNQIQGGGAAAVPCGVGIIRRMIQRPRQLRALMQDRHVMRVGGQGPLEGFFVVPGWSVLIKPSFLGGSAVHGRGVVCFVVVVVVVLV